MHVPASVNLASRVRINDDVVFQELQGEAVLLNLKSGVYFGLDPVGTRIWQLLHTQPQLAEVVKTLVSEYDVTEERIGSDLFSLVGELERQGLVVVS